MPASGSFMSLTLRWFALYKRPDNGTTKNVSGFLLVPIQYPHSVPIRGSKFVSNGAEIYVTGGTNDGVIEVPLSSVSILDCRSHTWHQAPNMKVARTYGSAKAIDGKVYVAGGFLDMNSPDWIEFFDPKTQTWKSVISPCCPGSTRIDETRFVVSELQSLSHCLVDNMVCYYYDGQFEWYENGNFNDSRIIKGLIGLPKFNRSSDVELVNYNGKMAVFWETRDRCSISKESLIWCAVITLERRCSEEIWGTVEWSDALLKVPEDHSFSCVLATTL